MYHTLRYEYEIKIGKRQPEKNQLQVNEGKHLMSDDEIIQKIKDSQTLNKVSTDSRRRKHWINYQFIHPGQWV